MGLLKAKGAGGGCKGHLIPVCTSLLSLSPLAVKIAVVVRISKIFPFTLSADTKFITPSRIELVWNAVCKIILLGYR